MKIYIINFILIISLIILLGCNNSVNQKLSTGFYGNYKGVDYSCGRTTGTTEENGKFFYKVGENCDFYINSISLEDIPNSKNIENKSLNKSFKMEITDLNTLRFLNSIDWDGDNSNGIEIKDKVKDLLNNLMEDKVITNNIADIDNLKNILNLLKTLDGFEGNLIDETEINQELKLNLENTISQYLANKTFYIHTLKEDKTNQAIELKINKDITRWTSRIIGKEETKGNRIKLEGNKLMIFKDLSEIETWTVSNTHKDYLSLEYDNFYIKLFHDKDNLENMLKGGPIIKKDSPFEIPNKYYTNISKIINPDYNTVTFTTNQYILNEDKQLLINKLIFDNNFITFEDDSIKYNFTNGEWIEILPSQKIPFRLSKDKKILNLQDKYFIYSKKIQNIEGITVRLINSDQKIIMPKDSKKITWEKENIIDIFNINKQVSFNSLKEVIEYQCGENYFKNISKESNDEFEGISFSCDYSDNNFGTLVGVKKDMSLIENMGTWKIVQLPNSLIEVILIQVDSLYYDSISHPLFAIKDNEIWSGNWIEAGTKDYLFLYNEVAFETLNEKKEE